VHAALAFAAIAGGFAAGTMNAVVGAGSLVSFPALLAAGVPPLTANVTNTVGLLPGALSAVHGYRAELTGRRATLVPLCVAGGIGGLVGGLLLLAFPSSTFEAVVPFLLVLAGLLTAVQPQVSRWVAGRRSVSPHGGPFLLGAVGLTAVYGGYFGAAQGIMLLAILGAALAQDLQRTNGLKNVLAGLVNGVAGLIFIFAAHVAWAPAAIIAAGSIAGAQLGARYGRRLPAGALRALIVAVGLAAIAHLVIG
jgi:uncharacterized protein